VTELRFWNNDVTQNLGAVLDKIKSVADALRASGRTPTRRWRADLPLSGGRCNEFVTPLRNSCWFLRQWSGYSISRLLEWPFSGSRRTFSQKRRGG
jgi:hypothetical protein